MCLKYLVPRHVGLAKPSRNQIRERFESFRHFLTLHHAIFSRRSKIGANMHKHKYKKKSTPNQQSSNMKEILKFIENKVDEEHQQQQQKKADG